MATNDDTFWRARHGVASRDHARVRSSRDAPRDARVHASVFYLDRVSRSMRARDAR
jgi:hypothetical protein